MSYAAAVVNKKAALVHAGKCENACNNMSNTCTRFNFICMGPHYQNCQDSRIWRETHAFWLIFGPDRMLVTLVLFVPQKV